MTGVGPLPSAGGPEADKPKEFVQPQEQESNLQSIFSMDKNHDKHLTRKEIFDNAVLSAIRNGILALRNVNPEKAVEMNRKLEGTPDGGGGITGGYNLEDVELTEQTASVIMGWITKEREKLTNLWVEMKDVLASNNIAFVDPNKNDVAQEVEE